MDACLRLLFFLVFQCWAKRLTGNNVTLIITDPPNGPVLFCWLSSFVVVCNAAGGPAGRSAAGHVGGPRPTLHGGPVVLRPVRATPCLFYVWRDVKTQLDQSLNRVSDKHCRKDCLLRWTILTSGQCDDRSASTTATSRDRAMTRRSSSPSRTTTLEDSVQWPVLYSQDQQRPDQDYCH